MSYTKKELEIHTHLAGLHEKYKENPFIHFEKTDEITGTQYLEPIIDAIQNKQVLKIYYHPFYEDKPYFIDVHPYLLKEYKFRWYLIGLNAFKEQVRTYALDRIRDVRTAEDVAYVEKQFNTAAYFRNSVGIMAPEGEPPLIKVAIQRTQAQYILSQAWHETQNLIEENEDELTFSFRVHPTYEFKSLLLSLGKDAVVLEPEKFRAEIAEELQALISKYTE